MNIDYDGTVHAMNDDGLPVCGNAMVSACEPEETSDDVNCWECESIIG